jgi:hypothetical protein
MDGDSRIPPEAHLTATFFHPVSEKSATMARNWIWLMWSYVIPDFRKRRLPIT